MRHTRQVRLREIAEAGQARLAASEVRVAGDGLGAEIEARYLAGAGVALVVDSEVVASAARSVDPDLRVTRIESQSSGSLRLCSPASLPCDVRDPTARELARGAHAALVAIRTILARGSA